MPNAADSPPSWSDAERRLTKLQRIRSLRAELAALDAAQITPPASPAALAVAHTAELSAEHRWVPFRWHQYLDDQLVALTQEPGESFQIVVAPIRHGKSKLCTVYFPAWWHGMYPHDPVIVTGHSAEFAEGFSSDTRDVVDACGHLFPSQIRVSPQSHARNRWDLASPHSGSHVAVGVHNPPIGKGGRLIVIDDPYSGPDKAYSENERDKVWGWWQGAIRGRLKPFDGAIVIIMSRWHEDDLVGRLLRAQEVGEEEGTGQRAFNWRVLELPALAEPSEEAPDPLGRATGEALWPEWFSAEHLAALRDNPDAVGRVAFEAQYQGRPTTAEGTMFRVDAWKYVAALHHETLLEADAGAMWLRRWDLASSEEKQGSDPDWTAGVLMARTPDGRVFVIDARRIRAEPLGVQRFIRATFEEDRERWGVTTVRMAIGPGEGKYAHSEFSRLVLPDADFGGKREVGSKDVRAQPWAAQVEAGNVFLLGSPEHTPWHRDYLEEHRLFPNAGRHDDWVDASALAYLDLAAGAGVDTGTRFVPRARHRR